MTEETIWQFNIEPGSSMTTVGQLDAALESILGRITGVVDTAGGLSVFDEVLSSIRSAASGAATSTNTMDEAMAQMQGTISEDNQVISRLNENIENLEGQISALTVKSEQVKSIGSHFGFIGNAVESAKSAFSGFTNAIDNVVTFGSKVGLAVFGVQQFVQVAEQVGGALIGGNASMEQTT